MDAQIVQSLLESIDADRLVLFTGAGLSMAEPTCLGSAAKIAERCYDDYVNSGIGMLDKRLRRNLGALAEDFAKRGRLESYFLGRLVPWEEFTFARPPNSGHRAVADLLYARACAAAVTANYDDFVEKSAQSYGADVKPAVDGAEAAIQRRHSPYLKVHGCVNRERSNTVWTGSQLRTNSVIKDRVERSRQWMTAHLYQKDLLFVGFWSQWRYLNDVFVRAMGDIAPRTVTLVDPADLATLKKKAKKLFAVFQRQDVHFQHVPMDGAQFLDELRVAYSKWYLRQALNAGKAAYESQTQQRCPAVFLESPDVPSEALYDLRRDAEGVPRTRPASLRVPNPMNEVFGFCLLLLRQAGATADGAELRLNGKRIRVLNGAGRVLGIVMDEFREAPANSNPDYIVCAGADRHAPGHILRATGQGDIVRPGAAGRWLDLDTARAELGF